MEAEDNSNPQEAPKKLTQGQKKALKEKQKKEEERKRKEEEAKKLQEQGIEAPQEPEPAKGKKDSKKGAKKPAVNAAAKAALLAKQRKDEEERLIREEEERIRKEEEEKERKIKEEEERQQRLKEEFKKKKKEEKKKLIETGEYLTPAQRKERQRTELARKMFLQQMEQNQTTQEKTQPSDPNQAEVNQNESQPAKQSQAVKKTKKRKVSDHIQQESQKIEEKKPEVQDGEELDDWEALLDDVEPVKETNKNDKKQPSRKQSQSSNVSAKSAKKSRKQSIEQLQDQISPPVTYNNVRSPIICILGHVDTGKTTLLDRIRNTHVQEGEAGGITQQIGATFFPRDRIIPETDKIAKFYPVDVDVPGLLIIDTPGHESFANLRNRGSSLCDMAILVVDIMHGLEPQTLESIELLKMRKTPFVIALNKIDRIYKWKTDKFGSSYKGLESQGNDQRQEFQKRYDEIMVALTEKGFNTTLYWQNENIRKYVSIVPTSGFTGEGVPDLFGVMLKYSQQFLKEKITLKDAFSCTVLEVKKIEGFGTTIDVILVNGTLKEGDKICLLGFHGVIKTYVRSLLTPHPMKEMRVKNEYLHFKEIKAAQGIKIAANDLDEAVAGSQLYVYKNEQEFNQYSEDLLQEFNDVKKRIKLSKQGVVVIASTLGSLEALMAFMKQSKIPVCYINVGNVTREDVLKCLKCISSDDPKKQKQEYACVLAFDVKVLPEAQYFADNNKIKIFQAKIIYHLFDRFKEHVQEVKNERKLTFGQGANFPCILQPVAFFNKKDPLVMGVDVEKGVLRVGTPIVVFDKEVNFQIRGDISNQVKQPQLRPITNKLTKPERLMVSQFISGSVAIKVIGDPTILAEKHFTLKDKFCSLLTRESIDLLLEHFRDEMLNSDWDVVRELKPFFDIFSSHK